MKKVIVFLTVLCMLMGLCACGSKADDTLGVYRGVDAEMFGAKMPMDEIYPGENKIELMSGGKGTIMLDGDGIKMEWSLEGQNLTVTIEGVENKATLTDGVIVMDLAGTGIDRKSVV